MTLTLVLVAAVAALDLLVGWTRPRDVLGGGGLWFVISGTAILAGLLARSWAAGTIRKWERLATTGPYALVRHPLYLGSAWMVLGFCGLMQAPLPCLLLLSPLAGIYWLTIRQEESVLARRYPEWHAYSQCTPRFLPGRLAWPRPGDWSFAQWLRNREFSVWLGAAAGAALLISRPWWTWLLAC